LLIRKESILTCNKNALKKFSRTAPFGIRSRLLPFFSVRLHSSFTNKMPITFVNLYTITNSQYYHPIEGCVPGSTNCSDGSDNDGDGSTDGNDPDCQPKCPSGVQTLPGDYGRYCPAPGQITDGEEGGGGGPLEGLQDLFGGGQ
jgi:hypothetical protein